MLNQTKESSHLNEISTLFIKEKDLQSFPELEIFDRIIVNEKYAIVGSKIFYLKADKPNVNGILDYEDLSISHKDG